MHKFLWNSNQNQRIFIQENAFEYVVCMSVQKYNNTPLINVLYYQAR